jgi:hypothetical protein
LLLSLQQPLLMGVLDRRWGALHLQLVLHQQLMPPLLPLRPQLLQCQLAQQCLLLCCLPLQCLLQCPVLPLVAPDPLLPQQLPLFACQPALLLLLPLQCVLPGGFCVLRQLCPLQLWLQ